jgi:peptide deformylase
MNKDDIITLPHEHLRQRSRKVGLINVGVKDLAANMQQALLDWEASREHELGVALAAVQVDEMVRVVVVRNSFEDKHDQGYQVFINPEITKYEGKLEEDYEGCLSIKDVYGLVPRYTRVRVKALDLQGAIIRIKADGFLARVLQHEIDHTNGIVFIDHIKDNPNAFFQLDTDGHLKELDYEKDIKQSRLLWE